MLFAKYLSDSNLNRNLRKIKINHKLYEFLIINLFKLDKYHILRCKKTSNTFVIIIMTCNIIVVQIQIYFE